MPRNKIADIAQDIVEMTDLPREIRGIVVTRDNVDQDPLDIKTRKYLRIHSIMSRIESGEDVTLREEIAALTLIERICPEGAPDASVGSSVRKYEGAFKNDARGRKKIARSTSADRQLAGNSDWFEQAAGNGDADHDHDDAG